MKAVTKMKPKAVGLPDVYTRWRVRIKLRDKLLGSMPKDPGDIERFAAAVSETDKDKEELTEKLMDEVPTDELADVGATTFKRDDTGLYIEARQVKAAFKEAATLFEYTKANCPGRQYFQHAFFVEPDVIYIGKTDPDGTERMFGTVMTARGPRSIVRNVDYAIGVEFDIVVKGLNGKNVITDEQIRRMLAMMQDNGIGACRSQGYGKFDVVEYETL